MIGGREYRFVMHDLCPNFKTFEVYIACVLFSFEEKETGSFLDFFLRIFLS